MNRVALITGASRGIGRGIAIELAQSAWDLAINYAENAAAAAETVQLCTEAAASVNKTIRVASYQADITSDPDRRRLLASVEAELGPIDLLVNNAGVAPRIRADLLDASEESFDELVRTNLKGPFLLTQSVAKRMLAAVATPSPGGRPTDRRPKIIFISSISSYTASVNRGDYCVTKAGIAMLTKLFAARLAENGIGVFEVRPGIIATDMTVGVRDKYQSLIEQGLTPIRRWGTPSDVGKAIAAIANDAFPFSTGEVLNVDGGFHLRVL